MTDELPIVDVGPFRPGAGPSAAAHEAAQHLDRCLRQLGFVMIANHGVTAASKAALLAAARQFFDLPVAVKDEIAIGRSHCHRGYVGLATESLDDANTQAGDLKETLDTGEDHGPDHPGVVAGLPLHGPNQLPDLPGFRPAFDQYRGEAIGAAERVMRAMAGALDLPERYFLELGETSYHLRMIHYPAQERLPPAEGQLGCGAHTDYGSLTVLADDGIGGLQVMRRDGTWIDVSIDDDLLVVNIGDLAAIWTNDRWVSNPHRVVNPAGVDRYSMPLFVSPPYLATISCLPTCLGTGEVPKYAPMQTGPYLMSRFDATHSYRNQLLAEHNQAVTAAYR
jgi:isopenicillin N synthase-like dioxygenase